jgi:hypothetical protein
VFLAGQLNSITVDIQIIRGTINTPSRISRDFTVHLFNPINATLAVPSFTTVQQDLMPFAEGGIAFAQAYYVGFCSQTFVDVDVIRQWGTSGNVTVNFKTIDSPYAIAGTGKKDLHKILFCLIPPFCLLYYRLSLQGWDADVGGRRQFGATHSRSIRH